MIPCASFINPAYKIRIHTSCFPIDTLPYLSASVVKFENKCRWRWLHEWQVTFGYS